MNFTRFLVFRNKVIGFTFLASVRSTLFDTFINENSQFANSIWVYIILSLTGRTISGLRIESGTIRNFLKNTVSDFSISSLLSIVTWKTSFTFRNRGKSETVFGGGFKALISSQNIISIALSTGLFSIIISTIIDEIFSRDCQAIISTKIILCITCNTGIVIWVIGTLINSSWIFQTSIFIIWEIIEGLTFSAFLRKRVHFETIGNGDCSWETSVS